MESPSLFGRRRRGRASFLLILAAASGCGAPERPRVDRAAAEPPLERAGELAAFLAWLRTSGGEDGRYVLTRFSTRSRYQMTGHAWSAFHGVRAFLDANPDLAAALANSTYGPRSFWAERPELQRRFASFVRAEGRRFPGQSGGAWTAKLPRSLGGTQAGGGAGSGLVARMLILLARYCPDRKACPA